MIDKIQTSYVKKYLIVLSKYLFLNSNINLKRFIFGNWFHVFTKGC